MTVVQSPGVESAADITMDAAGAGRWWNQPFRMFQTNLREIDADLDVHAVLDRIEELGANAWLIAAGGILSWYPTDLSFQTRNPWLESRRSGDLLGDAAAAAHRRGVRLLARVDFSKVPEAIATQHPEWCFLDPAGRTQNYNGLVSVCPSGEYYQSRAFDVLTEIVSRYPVDGFFFNWFGFNEVDYEGAYRGVCHCSACVTGYSAATGGAALPDGPDDDDYPRWRIFASSVIDDVTARLRAHIGALRPEAGLILGRAADIVFHEANGAIGREFDVDATAHAVSASRSARPDVPVLVNSVAFVDMPYRMAGEQPELFAQYLLQTISRGGNPSCYIMGPTGVIPSYDCLDAAAPILRFHRDNAALYAKQRPTARTVVVRPTGRDLDEFRGVAQALRESHVLFDVVDAAELATFIDNGGLDRIVVLLLADVETAEPGILDALDDWVDSGGSVLTTGSARLATGLSAAPHSQIVETRAGTAVLGSYVVGAVTGSGAHLRYERPVLPVYGRHDLVQWSSSAEVRLVAAGPAPFGPPEKAYGQIAAGAGFAIGTRGRGSVAVVPWTIGASYREFGTTVIRDSIVALVDDLIAGREPLSVHIADQVDVSVQTAGDEIVVHLLNRSGVRRRGVGPHLPIGGGTLRLAPGGWTTNTRVRALRAGVTCSTTPDRDALIVAIPTLEDFEVLVISGAHRPAPGSTDPSRAPERGALI